MYSIVLYTSSSWIWRKRWGSYEWRWLDDLLQRGASPQCLERKTLLNNYDKLVSGSDAIIGLEEWLNLTNVGIALVLKHFPKLSFLVASISACSSSTWGSWFSSTDSVHPTERGLSVQQRYSCRQWKLASAMCHIYIVRHLNATVQPSKCNRAHTVRDQRENWFLWEAAKMRQKR